MLEFCFYFNLYLICILTTIQSWTLIKYDFERKIMSRFKTKFHIKSLVYLKYKKQKSLWHKSWTFHNFIRFHNRIPSSDLYFAIQFVCTRTPSQNMSLHLSKKKTHNPFHQHYNLKCFNTDNFSHTISEISQARKYKLQTCGQSNKHIHEKQFFLNKILTLPENGQLYLNSTCKLISLINTSLCIPTFKS